jgi:WD40 repeat protein
MRTLTGHTGTVFSLVFSRDGTRIVSGSGDKRVKMWDTETGAEVSSHGACTWCSEGLDWDFRRAGRIVRRWRVLNIWWLAGAPADGSRGHTSQVF